MDWDWIKTRLDLTSPRKTSSSDQCTVSVDGHLHCSKFWKVDLNAFYALQIQLIEPFWGI